MADENAPKCNCETVVTASNNASSSLASECCTKQRFWWMLRTESFSDVCFIVGSDPNAQQFRAHRSVLASGSGVFRTMFDGKWSSESNPIIVPDVEPPVFFALLKFIYTDDITLSADVVMQILYIAKKYAVLALEHRCVSFLEKQLCAENAFTLLVQAKLFDEPQLVESCLKMIDENFHDSLSSDGFTKIDLATLCLVLKRDTLKIRETDLFEAILRWASAECKRKQLEINVENMKLVLEGAVQLVRYTLMTQEQFMTKVVPSNLLSDLELLDVLLYFGGSPKATFGFNTTPRSFRELQAIKRFGNINGGCKWTYTGNRYDSISFSFSCDVKLWGFGLYGPYSGESATYNVDMDVKHWGASNTILSKKGLICHANGSSKTYQILLENPIKLNADRKHSVFFKIQGPNSRSGTEGLTTVVVNHSQHGGKLQVRFCDTPNLAETNNTYTHAGQIPEILIEW